MNLTIIKGEICRYKIRTVSIIVCIAVAVALLYVSVTTFQTVLGSYADTNRLLTGNSDFTITSSEASVNSHFELKKVSIDEQDLFEYLIDAPNTVAIYQEKNHYLQLLVRGMELEELKKMDTFYVQSEEMKSFQNRQVLLNSEFSLEYGYKIGDTIQLDFMKKKESFVVGGIFEAQSIFSSKASENQIILPKSTLKHILDYSDNQTNMIYVKCKDNIEVDLAKRSLQKIYPKQLVSNSFSKDEYNEKMQGIQIIFNISSILIIIMCYMIVYHVFCVICRRRIKMLGVLRSLGATKTNIYQMILSEGFIYGSIGGVVGDILGMLFTFYMVHYLKPEAIANISFEPDYKNLMIGFGFSICVCLFVSFQAGKNTVSSEIKELLLETTKENENKRHKKSAIIGLLLFLCNFSIIYFLPEDSPMNLLVGIILIFIVTMLCFLQELIFTGIQLIVILLRKSLTNIGYLALQEIKADHNMKRCIGLIIISVSAILMTNSALNSIISSNIKTLKDNYLCDYILTANQLNNDIEEELKRIKEIKSCQRQYYVENVAVDNSNDYEIYNIDGFASDDYLVNRKFDVKNELLNNQGERKIILTDTIRTKLKLDEGDKIFLLDVRGTAVEYEVAGFFNTSINNGSYALIPQKFLIEDFGTLTKSEIYINLNNGSLLTSKDIEERLRTHHLKVQTVEEMVNTLFESSKVTFNAIKMISALPILVSIIILCGNSIISYYEQKRSLAVYRALGIDKSGLRIMFLIEHIVGGGIAASCGCIFGNLLVYQIRCFLSRTGSTMPVQYSAILSIRMFVLVMVLFIVPCIWKSIVSADFTIAAEIRYRE